MATDKNREIRCSYIEDELAFITVVLIDGRISRIEVNENAAQHGDGNIGNGVELLVGQSDASLVMSSNLRVVTGVGIVLYDVLNILRHGILQGNKVPN